MSIFNPIESLKGSPRNTFIKELSANIAQFSTIRIEAM